MKQTILLSYSTINELINEPHTWLCKQLGLKRLTTNAMKEGKEAHGVIQAHVSGKALDERLKNITVTFPIVEEKERDERCHFTYDIDSEYSVHGYLDGLDPENKRILEIKTSSTPWGMAKFHSLMQWRIYALFGDFTEAVFITSTRDLKSPAVYTLPITDKHRQEALDWIQKGIKIIESGNFDYKGEGRSFYCNYIACPFCGGPRV